MDTLLEAGVPASCYSWRTSATGDHPWGKATWKDKLQRAEADRDKNLALFNSLKDHFDHLNQKSEELEKENTKLIKRLSEIESKNDGPLQNYRHEKTEQEDALTRLCSDSTMEIRDNNPNIADLSDVNRPTKLAEKMSELYDNGWQDAFDSLEKSHPGMDIENKLVDILKNINIECQEMTSQDFFQHVQRSIDLPAKVLQECQPSSWSSNEVFLTKEMQLQLKELRKLRAPSVIHILQKTLAPKDADSYDLTAYHNKCVEVCWLAAVQDPPLFMNFNPGDKFDTTLFKKYTAKGQYAEFLVWPALHLHKDGPLLSKGVAQGSNQPVPRHTEVIQGNISLECVGGRKSEVVPPRLRSIHIPVTYPSSTQEHNQLVQNHLQKRNVDS